MTELELKIMIADLAFNFWACRGSRHCSYGDCLKVMKEQEKFIIKLWELKEKQYEQQTTK